MLPLHHEQNPGSTERKNEFVTKNQGEQEKIDRLCVGKKEKGREIEESKLQKSGGG
jgi:hypothetical protein